MTTTRFPSFGALRALAASRLSGRLVGGSWSTVTDRDLARTTADLLFLAQADDAPAARATRAAAGLTPPVDLVGRRAARTAAPVAAPAHAHAS